MNNEATINPINSRRITLSRTWLIGGVTILAGLILLGLNYPHLLDLPALISNRELLTAQLDRLGLWGPVLSLLLLSVQVVSPFIPGQMVTQTATGYLYGFTGGFVINLLGTVGASQLAFVFARRVGKSFVQRLIAARMLDRWQKVVEGRGFLFFLVTLWFPIIPTNITNYLAGLTSISFWLFLLANLLGRLPGAVVFTLVGSHGPEFLCHIELLSVWSWLPC